MIARMASVLAFATLYRCYVLSKTSRLSFVITLPFSYVHTNALQMVRIEPFVPVRGRAQLWLAQCNVWSSPFARAPLVSVAVCALLGQVLALYVGIPPLTRLSQQPLLFVFCERDAAAILHGIIALLHSSICL